MEKNKGLKSIIKLEKQIISNLIANGNKEKSISIEKYLKAKVKSRGGASPSIQSVYKILKFDSEYINLSNQHKFLLGTKLIKAEYIDDKSIGSSILSQLHKSIGKAEISELKKIINDGACQEWATCDSFAGKILRPYTILSEQNTYEIAKWRDEKCLWLRRMSCVTFITRVKHGDGKPNFKGFIDLMFEICRVTIVHQERFSQLATGWLLRELSLVNYEKFKTFIQENGKYITRESLRYAIEKLNDSQRKKYLSMRFE